MHWIAIHLPELALQVFLRGASSPEALAVGEAHAILAASETAQELGVRPGIGIPTAMAIAPGLILKGRAPEREQDALAEIAAWASQFTPHLCLAAPATVLLEVAASLRLFGGIVALQKRVATGCAALGFRVVTACAPTPLAAQLFARSGRPVIGDSGELAARLDDLPLQLLDVAPAMQETLTAIGARTLGDCLRLPRDGLARRCSPGLLRHLDRAYGRVPDPRQYFVPPETFSARIELSWPSTSTEPILFVAKRLLAALDGFLAARHAGIERFHLDFEHEDIATTRITISLASRSRDQARCLTVLREQVSRLDLAAPVLAVRLVADEIHGLVATSRNLFDDSRDQREPCARLLESLRARLGDEAVTGVRAVPTHRPEFAWETSEPGAKQGLESLCGSRPLWLLEPPQSLPERNALPQWDGPVALLAGPERIESGWWDGRDCSRDYYLASGPQQELLWLFRERRTPHGWYLHGLFA